MRSDGSISQRAFKEINDRNIEFAKKRSQELQFVQRERSMSIVETLDSEIRNAIEHDDVDQLYILVCKKTLATMYPNLNRTRLNTLVDNDKYLEWVAHLPKELAGGILDKAFAGGIGNAVKNVRYDLAENMTVKHSLDIAVQKMSDSLA